MSLITAEFREYKEADRPPSNNYLVPPLIRNATDIPRLVRPPLAPFISPRGYVCISPVSSISIMVLLLSSNRRLCPSKRSVVCRSRSRCSWEAPPCANACCAVEMNIHKMQRKARCETAWRPGQVDTAKYLRVVRNMYHTGEHMSFYVLPYVIPRGQTAAAPVVTKHRKRGKRPPPTEREQSLRDISARRLYLLLLRQQSLEM